MLISVVRQFSTAQGVRQLEERSQRTYSVKANEGGKWVPRCSRLSKWKPLALEAN